eukprot:4976922-Pyramimonas_sp.AAC.1
MGARKLRASAASSRTPGAAVGGTGRATRERADATARRVRRVRAAATPALVSDTARSAEPGT